MPGCNSLKWTNGDESLQSLQRFFNPNLTLDSMLQRIKEMMRVLPATMAAVIRFAVLTGLRPSEACESVRLICCKSTDKYYNPEQQTLEYFRFSQFLRPTKKAYISYLSTDDYQAIASLGPNTPTWNAIRHACNRRNINMDMRLCRRIFASWLVQKGIDSTTVDMLQGRCPASVLARHYQTPSNDLKDKVLCAIEKLRKQIE